MENYRRSGGSHKHIKSADLHLKPRMKSDHPISFVNQDLIQKDRVARETSTRFRWISSISDKKETVNPITHKRLYNFNTDAVKNRAEYLDGFLVNRNNLRRSKSEHNCLPPKLLNEPAKNIRSSKREHLVPFHQISMNPAKSRSRRKNLYAMQAKTPSKIHFSQVEGYPKPNFHSVIRQWPPIFKGMGYKKTSIFF